MQNHRGIMKLPQGDTTEISSVELEVPESARASREAMRAWLRDTQHIDVEIQRLRRRRWRAARWPAAWPAVASKRWMFNGGNARMITQVEYVEGASTAHCPQVTEQSPRGPGTPSQGRGRRRGLDSAD